MYRGTKLGTKVKGHQPRHDLLGTQIAPNSYHHFVDLPATMYSVNNDLAVADLGVVSQNSALRLSLVGFL